LPKKTVDIITSQGNEAIIQIKGNQEKIFNIIKELITEERLESLSFFNQKEKRKRNRIEYREAEVFQISEQFLPLGWKKTFKAIIRVRRYTDCFNTKKKQWDLRAEVSYYGSTCLLDAKEAAEFIRLHWHIENKNHYVRDVSLGEDASRIRKNPGIFARLRSFGLNLLRRNNITNVKEALFENALNLENLLNYEGIF
jgi:predicted transposase YbfD/YdcC